MNNFTRAQILSLSLTAFTLIACGGGGGGGALPPTDTTPPKVISTSPVSGKFTSANITIGIQFDEDINLPDSTNVDIWPFLANGSLNTSKPVFLKTPAITPKGSRELIIHPLTNGSSENALQLDTRYYVYIHGVQDVAGNSMKDCRFEFATGDYVGIINSSSNPCDTPQPISLNGQFEFAQASSSYSEGNTGTATQSITVYRVGGSDGLVTVAFELVSGSGTTGATQGSDFNPGANSSSGILSFPKGITSKTIDVDIIGDATPEGDETFSIKLSQATGGATIKNQSSIHAVTILNDDYTTNSPGKFEFSTPTSSVNETVFVNQIETANVAIINVVRKGGSSGQLEVGYSTTDGTAIASADYSAPVNGVLVFNDTDVVKPIKIPIVKDGLYEPTPETFTITITSINGSVINLANNTHQVSIVSNDPKPVNRIEFSLPTSTVDENVGSAIIKVTRSITTNATSVGYYTVADTATAGTQGVGPDFIGVQNKTVNFAAGSNSVDISIVIVNDNIQEKTESFFVKLQNPVGGVLGAVGTQMHEITIRDTFVPTLPGTIEFTTTTPETISEAAGNVLISVTRSGGSFGSLSVNYSTTAGTAVFPGDFQAVVNKPITFADGVAGTQNISIPIINDKLVEVPANKSFTVTLSGAAVGKNTAKTVTIRDAGVTRPLTTAELVAIWSLLL